MNYWRVSISNQFIITVNWKWHRKWVYRRHRKAISTMIHICNRCNKSYRRFPCKTQLLWWVTIASVSDRHYYHPFNFQGPLSPQTSYNGAENTTKTAFPAADGNSQLVNKVIIIIFQFSHHLPLILFEFNYNCAFFKC